MRNQRTQDIDRRSIFERILPEYEPISKAPQSVTDLPAFNRTLEDSASAGLTKRQMSKCIDDLEAGMLTAESEKKYKAMDGAGNIFLVINPLVWVEKNGKRYRPQPEFQMTLKQAIEELAGSVTPMRRAKKAKAKADPFVPQGEWAEAEV